MKFGKIPVILLAAISTSAFGQIKTPQASPSANVEQTVGLTNLEVSYSRPGKRGRTIFGDLVPYNQVWRTGANQNTLFMTSDDLVIGKDTLHAGTYAVYTKPMEKSWEVYFYTQTDNWGNPDKWDDSKVALKTSASVMKTPAVTESFTISFENLTSSSADLVFAWDQVRVAVPMKFLTEMKTMQSIERTMAGPAAVDYYAAARYYYEEKKDLGKALEWINTSIKMQQDAPFYYYRLKSLIQAENGDKKGAIESAKISMQKAEKAGNRDYIEMNRKSIEEWSK